MVTVHRRPRDTRRSHGDAAKVSEAEAQAKAAQVGYLLIRLQKGLIHIPESQTNPGMKRQRTRER
jgi:hypothetical protein